MPKFVITMPAFPFQHFEVESKDVLNAAIQATGLTVWTAEDFKAAQNRVREHRWPGFKESQKIDVFGRPVTEQ